MKKLLILALLVAIGVIAARRLHEQLAAPTRQDSARRSGGGAGRSGRGVPGRTAARATR